MSTRITGIIQEYQYLIAATYNIEPSELSELWNHVDQPDARTQKDANSELRTRSTGCVYEFKRGSKKGQLCGKKCKGGDTCCSQHKKTRTVVQDVKPERVLKMNKSIDQYWNPHTKLVFKSLQERTVVGKYDSGQVNNLTQADIQTCIDMNYAYKIISDDPELKISPDSEIGAILRELQN